MDCGQFSISRALAAASAGQVLEAQLFPLSGVGALRVTYNWLYSALNCDPSDGSTFTWTVIKLQDNIVCLTPKQPYDGKAVFASVRPDWSYYVQVQAPHSADWITAVGGDERLVLDELGFMTITLRGVNAQYLAVNGAPTQHDDHTGYKLQSNASAAGSAASFFVAVTRSLQAGLGVPLIGDLQAADVAAACAAGGASDPEALAGVIVAAAR